ncbi:MAG: hypothetical protein AAFW75_30510 [Cyanobacteria bacterium J06636_16]
MIRRQSSSGIEARSRIHQSRKSIEPRSRRRASIHIPYDVTTL